MKKHPYLPDPTSFLEFSGSRDAIEAEEEVVQQQARDEF